MSWVWDVRKEGKEKLKRKRNENEEIWVHSGP